MTQVQREQGLEALFNLIVGGGEIYDTVQSALSDDGKITGFEWLGVMTAGVKHWRIFADFNKLWAEIGDITVVEEALLIDKFAKHWAFTKPAAERRFKAIFKYLVNTANLFTSLKASESENILSA